MTKKSLVEKLASALEAQAEREACKVKGQYESCAKLVEQKCTAEAKKAAKQDVELKSLSKIFAAVSDADIIQSLESNKPIVMKSWKGLSIINGTDGLSLTQLLDTQGGNALTTRLAEVSAGVSSVNLERKHFSDMNIENLFLRHALSIHLEWKKDEFKQAVQQKTLQNTM
tara:strand:+ start:101575 stop:102084 length:510 start_codon:yes stop_codon:yes gene_type:complete